MLEIAIEGRLGGEPRRGFAAARAVLHPLGGQVDLLLDTEGGAQQDRFVGGAQLSLRLGEQLGDRLVLGRRCGGSSTTPTA